MRAQQLNDWIDQLSVWLDSLSGAEFLILVIAVMIVVVIGLRIIFGGGE